MAASTNLSYSNFYKAETRLFIESFFEMSMTAGISLLSSPEILGEGSFLVGDVINMVLTVVTVLLIVSLLLCIFQMLWRGRRGDQWNTGIISSIMTEGLRPKGVLALQYNLIFLVRRLIIVYTLVFMQRWPFAQTVILLVFSSAH